MKQFVIIFAVLAAVSCELITIEQLKGILPLVAGGSPATQGQFPYQVAIITASETDLQFCGGTLIKHKWVLTAATCIQGNIKNIAVVIGTLSLLEDEPAYVYNSTLSSNFKIHPDYNSVTNVNNIALIKIDEMPANITDHKNVDYIGLPTEEEAKTNLTGKDISISGFGLHGAGDEWSLIIHHAKIQLAPTDVCKDFRLAGGYYNVSESTLCIDTSSGKSPCLDGGGPMTIEIGSKKVLVGILGLNTIPCSVGNPALAENVFYHREWIEKTSGSSEVTLSFSIFAAIIMMTIRNLF